MVIRSCDAPMTAIERGLKNRSRSLHLNVLQPVATKDRYASALLPVLVPQPGNNKVYC